MANGLVYLLENTPPPTGLASRLGLGAAPGLGLYVIDADGNVTYLQGGGLCAYAQVSNGAGNSTLTFPPGVKIYTVNLLVTGSAGTRILILPDTGLNQGEKLFVNYRLPATAGIVIEARNGTAGGTLLDTLTTDTSGDDATLVFTFTGSAFIKDFSLYPSS
jgi:hypothetical protein